MICKCGHDQFYFIGVQNVGFTFLNLFNCYKCRTTVSEYQDREAIPKMKGVSASSVRLPQGYCPQVMSDYVSFISK